MSGRALVALDSKPGGQARIEQEIQAPESRPPEQRPHESEATSRSLEDRPTLIPGPAYSLVK